MPGPLAGIRVIDLTTIVMGPYATQILGDMGADVIKVEPPAGDLFREVAPFRHHGMGAAFLNVNRNKRSLVLNLELEEDKQILIKLLTTADVFVYTLRPRSLVRFGLDYNSLHERHPRLIHCGAYGFSEEGPYRGRPAYDDVIQAMSGTASLEARNNPDGPRFVNTIMADKIAGLSTAYAIAAALYEREQSGLGQAIEVPMFETLVSFNMIEHLAGETFWPAIGSMGYDRVLSPYRRPYRTKDGYIGLMPYSTAQWQRFFEVAGKPQYAADARFTEHAARSESINELYLILAEILTERSTSEWIRLLESADIPVAPVLSPQELLEDQHLNALDFFHRDRHPSEGEIRTVSSPVRFSRTPATVQRLAPRLDEHREEILEEAILVRGDFPMSSPILSASIRIRRATPEDADTCGRICYEAFATINTQHNFAPELPSAEAGVGLLKMLFSHPRFYGVVAELDGRIVGSNCLDERSVIAGIGPITVEPTVQNRSIGRMLMEAVLDRAHERGFPGVRLLQGAFHNRSLSLYTKLGFVAREPISVMQGSPLKKTIEGYTVRRATEKDVKIGARVCEKVHGHNRTGELRDGIAQNTAVVVERHGRVTGYGSAFGYFGHAVAESNLDLQALIGAAESFGGPGILVPTRNTELFRSFLENGLRLVQPMTLMTIGLYNEPTGAYLPSILY